jgi:hypothetical protein
MKRITLLLALFCLGLMTASLAVAKAPPGKGKGKKKTTTSSTATNLETCHPKISVILKGKFVSGGGDSFTMDVTRSNFHGKQLVGEALSIKVDDKTRFVRQGPAELSDFKAGDRLNVQARACKVKKQKNKTGTTTTTTTAAAPAAEATPMLAKRVVGRPANPAETRGETTTTTATP